MVTAEQLARATGASLPRATIRLAAYIEILPLYTIDTPVRLAMFLANVGHETGGFRFVEEIWGPTDSQHRYERDPLEPWPANPGEARQPQFEANRLAYQLGNTQPADGVRYKGRGDLETTGRMNYRLLTMRLRQRFPTRTIPDFEALPETLKLPRWACFSACDYIAMKGNNAAADEGNFDHYCDLINRGRITPAIGDSNGYAQRVILWHAAKAALGIT